MKSLSKDERIILLENKLKKFELRLAEKRLGYGEVVRTRFGDSYEDQLRDDTNVLEGIIKSIKEEMESLKK
jgi:hypothetical protein